MTSLPWQSSRRTFVDSSAYYALSDSRENTHERAIAIAHAIERAQWPLYTSNFILAETHALLLRRLGRRLALTVIQNLMVSRTVRIRVTAADEARALAILVQYADKEWSYTDATSFAIMQRLGIRLAFTFDGDYGLYGFTMLTPALT